MEVFRTAFDKCRDFFTGHADFVVCRIGCIFSAIRYSTIGSGYLSALSWTSSKLLIILIRRILSNQTYLLASVDTR